jgi:hypothetical protein
LKNLEKSDDGAGAEERGEERAEERAWPLQQQAAAQLPPNAVPVESLPIPQRLAMIEQALGGLAMSLQNAASRQGVTEAIKEVDDKITALDAKLSAFQGIVTETLSLTTRLDGLDRAIGEVVVEIQRLPSRIDISQVLDQSARVQGAQTAINNELGRLGGLLGRLLRLRRWQLLGVLFIGIGVLCAGAALLVVAVGARPG